MEEILGSHPLIVYIRFSITPRGTGPWKKDFKMKRGRRNADGATVKVSFSVRFATLSEGIDRDHSDNNKESVCFWNKDDRANSIDS